MVPLLRATYPLRIIHFLPKNFPGCDSVIEFEAVFALEMRSHSPLSRTQHTYKDNVMTPHCLTTCFARLPMMILALLALALQGCGDGVRILPSDADPSGYYNRDGFADVDDGASGTRRIEHLQALVNGDRIMMMSTAEELLAEGLLYDGTITSIKGTAFEADFMIYTNGENPIPATARGTILDASKITGTLTSSANGVGSGTFTLLYATTNNQAAAIVSAWRGFGGGFDEFGFIIDGAGGLLHDKTAGYNLPFFQCEMNGTVTSVSNTRLYRVGVKLTACNDPDVNGAYTGLTTTRDASATDDRLVYAVSNGTHTLSGEFNID